MNKMPQCAIDKRNELFPMNDDRSDCHGGRGLGNTLSQLNRDGFNAAWELFTEQAKEPVEGLLKNFASDWYIQELGKDTAPGPATTGIAAKIYNQDMLARIKHSIKSLHDLHTKLWGKDD